MWIWIFIFFFLLLGGGGWCWWWSDGLLIFKSKESFKKIDGLNLIAEWNISPLFVYNLDMVTLCISYLANQVKLRLPPWPKVICIRILICFAFQFHWSVSTPCLSFNVYTRPCIGNEIFVDAKTSICKWTKNSSKGVCKF